MQIFLDKMQKPLYNIDHWSIKNGGMLKCHVLV